MASVYKRKYTQADGTIRTAEKWTIDYKDEFGRTRTVAGFKDKKATEEWARTLERNAERKRAGLPIVGEGPAHCRLREIVKEYLADMDRQGLSASHRRETRRLLETLWREAGWVLLQEVRAAPLVGFLNRLQGQGKAPRTLNSYRDALVAFCNWCRQQRPPLLAENPVDHVRKASGRGKKSKPRRAYTEAEWRQLCATSLHHGTLYAIAGLSGLRRGTLRQLEKRDLDPTGAYPEWHIRAEIMKGRRPHQVAMLKKCAAILKPLWEALPSPTSRLFAATPDIRTRIRDLRRAQVPRVDPQGRTADFHSFRYFFCALCARRFSIRTVQLLMGHKSIQMTIDLYGELGLKDLAEEVRALPPLFSDSQPIVPTDPKPPVS